MAFIRNSLLLLELSRSAVVVSNGLNHVDESHSCRMVCRGCSSFKLSSFLIVCTALVGSTRSGTVLEGMIATATIAGYIGSLLCSVGGVASGRVVVVVVGIGIALACLGLGLCSVCVACTIAAVIATIAGKSARLSSMLRRLALSLAIVV